MYLRIRWSIFFVSAALFALSLLPLIRLGAIWAWIASLCATEAGQFLTVLCFALAVFTPATGWASVVARLLAVAAFCLFILPSVRSLAIAGPERAAMSKVFPVQNPAPWVRWWKLFLPPSPRPVTPEQYVCAEANGHELRLEFRRAAAAPAPCIVMLHTGSWNSGNRTEFTQFSDLLAGSGYAVASVEYRLAPEWKWPAQREDVLTAIEWLSSNAEQLGIAPDRFCLLGRSAGGQIAEAVAYGAHDPRIRGLIAFYAPADMDFAYRYARSDDILDSLKLLRDYTGGSPEEFPDVYRSASGIALVDSHSPPTLLFHGALDELVWVKQSRRLSARLAEAGVPHHYVELPWATHAFDLNTNGPGGQIAVSAVLQFLRAVFES